MWPLQRACACGGAAAVGRFTQDDKSCVRALTAVPVLSAVAHCASTVSTAVSLLGLGVVLKLLLVLWFLRTANTGSAATAKRQGDGLLSTLVATCLWWIGQHTVRAAEGSTTAFTACACAWGAAYIDLWRAEIRSALGSNRVTPVVDWQDARTRSSGHDRRQRVLMAVLLALPPFAVFASMPQALAPALRTQWQPL